MKHIILALSLISMTGCTVPLEKKSDNHNQKTATISKRTLYVNSGDGEKGNISIKEVDIDENAMPLVCDQKIIPIYMPSPIYPSKVRKEKMGAAEVSLMINPKG